MLASYTINSVLQHKKYILLICFVTYIYARVQESWAKLMTLQILQGGIQPWAPAGGGGGGKSRRSIAPTPLKKLRKL